MEYSNDDFHYPAIGSIVVPEVTRDNIASKDDKNQNENATANLGNILSSLAGIIPQSNQTPELQEALAALPHAADTQIPLDKINLPIEGEVIEVLPSGEKEEEAETVEAEIIEEEFLPPIDDEPKNVQLGDKFVNTTYHLCSDCAAKAVPEYVMIINQISDWCERWHFWDDADGIPDEIKAIAEEESEYVRKALLEFQEIKEQRKLESEKVEELPAPEENLTPEEE